MRFFYEENIDSEIIELSPETAKHVTQVLRMKVGDQFVLTDGQGKKATVEISDFGKRNCTVRILQTEQIENQNANISLAISFTKNNSRMVWLLEKITEIGVRNIYPIQTSRSEKSGFKMERFKKKLISAMLQSQQYYLPVLHDEVPFEKLLNGEIATDATKKYIAHCESNRPRMVINDPGLQVKESVLILIGPEGDFTTEEIDRSLQQNFKSVSLGKNRLRTETAGLVAVTLLNHYAH